MIKTRIINLNNYEMCGKEDATLIIVPSNNIPALYYKRKKPLDLITSLDGVMWVEGLKFDTHVDQDQYNKIVDWWFDNLSEGYVKKLADLINTAIEYGFDLSMSVNKARNKLKLMKLEERKSKLDKFLLDWVVKGATYWLKKYNRSA